MNSILSFKLFFSHKIIAFILVLTTLISGGVYVYVTRVYIPRAVAYSLNTNISLLNTNLRTIEQDITHINEQYSILSDKATTPAAVSIIQNIQDNNVELSQTITDTEELVPAIHQGINQDTRDFALLTNNTLKSRANAIRTIQEVINFDSCFNLQLIQFVGYNATLSQTIGQIQEKNINESTQDIINLNTQARENIKNAIQTLQNMLSCLQGYERFSENTGLSEIVTGDIATYTQFDDFVSKLITAIQEENIDAINTIQESNDSQVQSELLQNNNYQKSTDTSNKIISRVYRTISDSELQAEKEVDRITQKYSI